MNPISLMLILLPVFVPIFFGFASVRFNIFKAEDAHILTRFFLYIALPALIVSLLAGEKIENLFDIRFILGMLIVSLILFMAAFFIHHVWFKKSEAESAFAAMCAS